MSTGNPTAERFEVSVAATSAAVAETRRAFERWLDAGGVDEGVSADLLVVFSELVTNAARAVGGSGSTITACGWQEGSSVVLEVANRVRRSRGSVTRWDLDDPLRAGGRGLLIVRAYTDDVQVDTVDDSIVVRCRRSLSTS